MNLWVVLPEFCDNDVLNITFGMQVVIPAYCDQVCQNKTCYYLLNMLFLLIWEKKIVTSRKFNVICFVVFVLGGDNEREGDLCALLEEVLEGFC